MDQDEFNTMLVAATDTIKEIVEGIIADGLSTGYYTSKYSGEEMDTLLDLVAENLQST